MNPSTDFYFDKANKWQPAIRRLRILVLDCGLVEALKWGVPCYSYNNKNVVLIHVFKEYCALLFFKGALLSDVQGILIQQTANVQAARQIRFTSLEEVNKMSKVITKYIQEAIAIEKAGLAVTLKKTSELVVTDELKQKFKTMPALKNAFQALTPGRQRAYMLHFSAPKQAKTRVARVDKAVAQIIAGKGLND